MLFRKVPILYPWNFMNHVIILRGQKQYLLMPKQIYIKLRFYFKWLSEVWLKLRVSLVE